MLEFVSLEEVARVEVGQAVNVQLPRFVRKLLLFDFHDFLINKKRLLSCLTLRQDDKTPGYQC